MTAAMRSSVWRLEGQSKVWLVSIGHGTTHWIMATFFVVLPFLARDLGLSYARAGLLVSTFYVSSFLANFASGVAVDVTGRRVAFQVVSLVLGGVAIVGFGLSTHFLLLCLMIAVVGVSNNLWHPAAIAFLSERFPANRGYVLSVHALFASIGDAVAPVAAGVLLAATSWQATSATSAAPSLVLAAMLAMLMLRVDAPAASGSPRGMDRGAYLEGMLRLVRSREIVGLALMAGFRSMAQSGLLMFLPLYLADGLRVSPVVLGAAMMAMQAGGMVAGPLAGVLSDRIGRRPVVMAGLSATTIIIVLATLVGNAMLFIACISVLGFAMFAVRPVIHSWMMDLVPAEFGASGTSLLFGVQAVLSMLTPLIGGFLADHYGLLSVFYFLAATMLVANLGVIALPRPAPVPQPAE